MAASVPAVTVVTITWNNAPGLRRTLESLATQDLDDVQHVVIDGGSTDGSVEWLAEHRVFADTVVVSEPDRGIYDAMNKGAALAKGTLITFLNAGDAYARAGVLSDAVASNAEHGWDWAFGLARVVDGDGRQLRPVRPVKYSFRGHALGTILVPHQATFMRVGLFRELDGFNHRFGLQADVDLLLRAGEVSRPVVWNRIDVEYLAGGASDVDVYRSIYRKHRIRRALRSARRTPRSARLPTPAIDLLWTSVQIATVFARKSGKRALNALSGGRFTTWWASRGLSTASDGTFDLHGVPLAAQTYATAIDRLLAAAVDDQPFRGHFCTVHSFVESQSDSVLRAVFASAQMVAMDGMPLVWVAHRHGFRSAERVCGPDVMLSLLDRGRSIGLRHFLLGGQPGIPEQLRDRLTARFPGLDVVGVESPPFRQLTQDEDAALVERINATRPDVVWIGLGSPKQELWAAAHGDRLSAPLLLPVGAAFDFHSGRIRRAPLWMQRAGLEWMYRVGADPRRLWRRYVVTNSRFLAIILGDTLRRDR